MKRREIGLVSVREVGNGRKEGLDIFSLLSLVTGEALLEAKEGLRV